jgi:hypothetical protein
LLTRIQKLFKTAAGFDPHMVTAFRTNLQVPFQFRAIQDRCTYGALGPKTFGHITFIATFGANS